MHFAIKVSLVRCIEKNSPTSSNWKRVNVGKHLENRSRTVLGNLALFLECGPAATRPDVWARVQVWPIITPDGSWIESFPRNGKKGCSRRGDKWLDLIWSEPNCYSFESTACDLVLAGLSLFYGNQKRDCFNVWSSYLLHTSGGIIFCQRSNSAASDAAIGIQLEGSNSTEKKRIKNKVRFSLDVNIVGFEDRTMWTAGLGCQIMTCHPDAIRNRGTHSN